MEPNDMSSSKIAKDAPKFDNSRRNNLKQSRARVRVYDHFSFLTQCIQISGQTFLFYQKKIGIKKLHVQRKRRETIELKGIQLTQI